MWVVEGAIARVYVRFPLLDPPSFLITHSLQSPRISQSAQEADHKMPPLKTRGAISQHPRPRPEGQCLLESFFSNSTSAKVKLFTDVEEVLPHTQPHTFCHVGKIMCSPTSLAPSCLAPFSLVCPFLLNKTSFIKETLPHTTNTQNTKYQSIQFISVV